METIKNVINELVYDSYATNRDAGNSAPALWNAGIGNEEMEFRYQQEQANKITTHLS